MTQIFNNKNNNYYYACNPMMTKDNKSANLNRRPYDAIPCTTMTSRIFIHSLVLILCWLPALVSSLGGDHYHDGNGDNENLPSSSSSSSATFSAVRSNPFHNDTLFRTTAAEKESTLRSSLQHPQQHRRRLLLDDLDEDRTEPLRILYTITTLAEYDEGSRATTKGWDRLSNLLVPVVKEGVLSMMAKGYHVDVFIVSHYTMTRPEILREALPAEVNVRYWDNAGPISYKPDKRDDPNAKLWHNTLALARQHRFVVKDNLFDYDMFLNFEDDMIIHGDMVEHHLRMTKTLFKLRETAPEEVPNSQLRSFYGPLTKDQLKRCYPGLLRVEVLLDEETYGTQPELDAVPVASHPDIDPRSCCHLSDFAASEKRPQRPGSDKLFLWETNIIALGVRHIEGLGWVTLLRGPRKREGEEGLVLSDYWSGTKKYFGKDKRPSPGSFGHINNQGGWMGTRQQIWEWHTEICLGGFLPPFDSPHYNWVGFPSSSVLYQSSSLHTRFIN
jgi:hypothetical protein